MYHPARTALIITLLLVAGFGPMGASTPLGPPPVQTAPCQIPEGGEWVINTLFQVTCEDRTLVVKNITIGPGSSLTLRNVELIMDAGIDSDGGVTHWDNVIFLHGNDHGLVPYYGAQLYVDDSVIRSSNEERKHGGIEMWGGTTVVMHNSAVRDAYAGIATASGIQRLEVKGSRLSASWAAIAPWHSDRVLIEDNLFTGPGIGVAVWGPTGIIRGNTFVGCTIAVDEAYGGASTQEISHNTMTGCQDGFISIHCNGDILRNNDIFRNLNDWGRNLPTHETHACGNHEYNWWGEKGPNPERFGKPADYTPWLAEPAHPERLPTAVLDAPSVAAVGEPVQFSAARSASSLKWKSPLAAYEWTFDGHQADGMEVEHVFCEPGQYEVSVLVTDELGISRMAFADILVDPAPDESTPC